MVGIEVLVVDVAMLVEGGIGELVLDGRAELVDAVI